MQFSFTETPSSAKKQWYESDPWQNILAALSFHSDSLYGHLVTEFVGLDVTSATDYEKRIIVINQNKTGLNRGEKDYY